MACYCTKPLKENLFILIDFIPANVSQSNLMIFLYVAFQCDNGHVVCSICCSRQMTRCQRCFPGITLKRSRAIENLLQSIKISCPNVKHGCKERITYSGKKKHEEECIYVPCSCPVLGCDFVTSSEVLSSHFSHKHRDSWIQFSYDSPFFVTLNFNDEAIILQEKSAGKLFILNKRTRSVENAFNIRCIGPPKSSEPRYYYDILVRSQKSSAKFHSFSKNVQRVSLETLSSEFLLIQFGSSEPLKLEICITPKVSISFLYLNCSSQLKSWYFLFPFEF